MNKVQSTALRIFLFIALLIAITLIFIMIDRSLQIRENFSILVLILAVFYVLALCLIPSVKNERVYSYFSICAYVVVFAALICTSLVTFDTITPSAYAGIILSMLIPGFAMLLRGDFKKYQVVVFACVSVVLFVPCFIISLFVIPFTTAVFYLLPVAKFFLMPVATATIAIVIFLAFMLFFRVKKIPFRYRFILLISFFPAILFSILMTVYGLS